MTLGPRGSLHTPLSTDAFPSSAAFASGLRMGTQPVLPLTEWYSRNLQSDRGAWQEVARYVHDKSTYDVHPLDSSCRTKYV